MLLNIGERGRDWKAEILLGIDLIVLRCDMHSLNTASRQANQNLKAIFYLIFIHCQLHDSLTFVLTVFLL